MNTLPPEIILQVQSYCSRADRKALNRASRYINAIVTPAIWRVLCINLAKCGDPFSEDSIVVDVVSIQQFHQALECGDLHNVLKHVQHIMIIDDGYDYNEKVIQQYYPVLKYLQRHLHLLTNLYRIHVHRKLSKPPVANGRYQHQHQQTATEKFVREATFNNCSNIKSSGSCVEGDSKCDSIRSTSCIKPGIEVRCYLTVTSNNAVFPESDTVVWNSVYSLVYSMSRRPRASSKSYMAPFSAIVRSKKGWFPTFPRSLRHAKLFLPGATTSSDIINALASSQLKTLEIVVPTSMNPRYQLNWIPISVEELCLVVRQSCWWMNVEYLGSEGSRFRRRPVPLDEKSLHQLPNVILLDRIGNYYVESIACLRMPALMT